MTKETIKATAIWGILGLIGGLLIAWLFMGSGGPEAQQAENHQHQAGTVYTCSMHPQVRQSEPGLCPLCGMELIPASGSNDNNDSPDIKLSSYAQTLAGVETLRIGMGQVDGEAAASVQLSGQLQVAESNLYSQVAHIPGRIEQLFINTTGETVRQGQALASIYSPELLAAQQELIQATKLSGNYAGLLGAARQKLKQFRISNSQIQRIEKEGRTFDKLSVVADADGIVTNLLVTQGTYVSVGQPLMQIARLNTLWATFDAYENQLAKLSVGQNLLITVNATGKSYPAKITFIDPVLDGGSRTVRVRAEVDNAKGNLRPQMLVQAKINIEDFNQPSAQEIIVPRSAVLWTGERSIVYVKNAETGNYQMREVSVSVLGASYIVNNGLFSGEEVVVNGTFIVDAAAQLQNKPSMMNRAVQASKLASVLKLAEPPTTYKSNAIFKENLDGVIATYIELKDALVASNRNLAQRKAQALTKKSSALKFGKLSGEASGFISNKTKQITSSAQKIDSAQTLDQQRAYFIGLSQDMLALAEAFPDSTKRLYRQYCPMASNNAGAYWLSADQEIKNPYYGDLMLSCGEVVKEF